MFQLPFNNTWGGMSLHNGIASSCQRNQHLCKYNINIFTEVFQFENSPLQGVHVERGLVAAQHDADEDPQIAHVLLRHHAPWQVTVVHITFSPVFGFAFFQLFTFFLSPFFLLTLLMGYFFLNDPSLNLVT